MKIRHLLYLLPLLASGCIIEMDGITSGYKKLTAEQKQKIKIVADGDEICSLENDQTIYAVTAGQLLPCLKNRDSSVVYVWNPVCSATNCILLGAAQSYCDRNNYALYVVAELYKMEPMEGQNSMPLPMFSINHAYYKTDMRNKGRKRFLVELSKHDTSGQKLDTARFLVFHRDTLVRQKENLLQK